MGTLSMSKKERARLEVFGRVRDEMITLTKASELLGISYRQTKRSWTRFQEEGDAGLVHKLRGRASNRQGDERLKAQVLEAYQERYSDYGPTLASEYLAEEGLVVPITTLRRWLLEEGLWSQKRRRKRHRRRRPRRAQAGELVQLDGSHHDWFEGRRDWAVLMVMIDDAMGRIYARFFEAETLAAAWETVDRYIDRHGLPRALYVDQHGIYRSDKEPTAEQLLAGERPPTQFGRSMTELEVKLILAKSPQAKGRVERMNGTLQDRLVKALRRADVSDLAAANRFLEEEFLPAFNARFRVKAQKQGDLHRPLPKGTDLAKILSEQEERVVQNDWTVRWRGAFLQLSRDANVQPKDQVLVCEQLDGRVRIFAGERELSWSNTRSEPARRRKKPLRSSPTKSSQGQKPAPSHPFRRSYKTMRTPPPPPGEGARSAPAR